MKTTLNSKGLKLEDDIFDICFEGQPLWVAKLSYFINPDKYKTAFLRVLLEKYKEVKTIEDFEEEK